jgi:uncharacterized protein
VTRHLKRIAALTLGWALVGLGVLGLFLPLLQGLMMIALGLYVLSRESRAVHHRVERLRGRLPALDRVLSEVRRRFPRERSDSEDADGPPPAV